MTVNVICMKWGALYGPHYVNRLYAMVARHLSRPFRFACLTDDRTGLRPEVEAMPIPDIKIDPDCKHLPWRKMALYAPEIGDLSGPTLFLDLDLLVVGSLDPFFEHPGEFCIIHNWTNQSRSITGNSSVFRWEIGAQAGILETFESRPTRHWIEKHRNSQTFLSAQLGREKLTYWPDEWCVSFKKHCLPGRLRNWIQPATIPDGARIVVFHGYPNPDDALAGRWPGGWYKRLRPALWIADHWRED